jgi:hypothetical protein
MMLGIHLPGSKVTNDVSFLKLTYLEFNLQKECSTFEVTKYVLRTYPFVSYPTF